MKNKAIVIGSGVGGLASAIRLQKKGYKVTLLEKNEYPGGKVTQVKNQGFTFDAGPSLFTLPQLMDELFEIAESSQRFEYEKLDEVCTYFFEDGTHFTANGDSKVFCREFSESFKEPLSKVKQFVKTIKRNYELTSPVFLESSLHKIKTYIKPSGLKGIANLWRLNMFRSMHQNISAYFSNPNAIQFFNRFATYNGSNPYKAPATLCVIPNIEINKGAYFPKGGMQSITTKLLDLATETGVDVRLNTEVKRIKHLNGKITGVDLADGTTLNAEIVVSNADAKLTYSMLGKTLPKKIEKAENSSSAIIFYWGIKGTFKELGLHNILFSQDYKKEFEEIFNTKTLPDQPTVYINISSKLNPSDAPKGCENWFVMINAPADYGQDWSKLVNLARERVVMRINKALGEDIKSKIQTENILTPPLIAQKTGSDKGSLYGSSSNNRMSAFFRQANHSSKLKGLYFCGGSVHPGGGIPLCLYGAKIVGDLVPNPK